MGHLRSIRLAGTVAIAFLAAAALGLPSAAGAAAGMAKASLPRDALTRSEYTELSAMYAGLLDTSNGADWATLTAACEQAGTSTSLLATQRSSCVDEINTLAYVQTVSTDEKRCDSAIAARAPADATTVEDLAALQQIACLNGDYQQLGQLAGSAYAQEVSARRSALARGFSGVCLNTLVDTPAQLVVVGNFAHAAEGIAEVSGRLTKLAGRGTTPAPSDIAQFFDRAKVLGNAFDAMIKLSGPTKLSVCPHK